MRRGSKTGKKVKKAKTSRRKAAAPKRVAAPKPVRRASSTATGPNKRIALLKLERDEALAYQRATAEILSSISSASTDVKPVLDAIVRNLLRLFGASTALVALLRDGMIHVGALGGEPGFERMAERYPLPLNDTSVPGRAMSSKHVIHLAPMIGNPDTPASSVKFARDFGFNSLISAPMLRGDKVVGAIIAARGTAKPFHAKQIELIRSFAAQAVIAIENARLLSELRESLKQQTATADVLKVISRSTFDLQAVLDALVETAAQLCEATSAFVYRREGEKYRLDSTFGFSVEYKTYMIGQPIGPGRQTLVGRTILEGKPVHIADARNDPEYTWKESQLRGGYRTMLGVPLMRGGAPIGVLSLTRSEVKPFTDRQIELVTTFADQAVIAIENVRLFDDVQKRTAELTESLQQQIATANVLKVISSSPGELEPVFEIILENAARICEANFGNILRFENGQPQFIAKLRVPEQFFSFLRRSALRPGPLHPFSRLIAQRQTVHVTDYSSDPSYLDRDPLAVAGVELGNIRSLLIVPMLKDGALIGGIAIYRNEVRPFTDKQIALMTNFAAQAVIAIENTRLLSELRESLQQQTATADVLKVISRSTFDLQTVLDTLVESAALLCEADKASINRAQDDAYRAIAMHGFPPEFKTFAANYTIPAGNASVVGRTVTQGAPIQVPDVTADPDYKMSEIIDFGQIRTILGVPMLREGKPTGVIVLMRNEVRPFTERQIELAQTFADQAVIAIENVRLFESVEARTRELAKSLEELHTAQDRLVQTEKLASLGQLTAGIAHEIKNPLNFVNNFSSVSVELIEELREALSRAQLDDKLRAEIGELADMLQGNLDKVVQHGKRANSIVKNMLLHSREGSGEHRPVDINALVEESLNLAYHGARAERQGFNITLERSFDPSAGEADLFPQEITRVLLNLISNGFYAATKRLAQTDGGKYEPTLSAATKNLGGSVEITIRDNGAGIPPEVKDKMFNPFFTTKPAGEGTGLGLSISHDIIVKQHGGSITVDTEPEHFTEFKIVLPRKGALLVKP